MNKALIFVNAARKFCVALTAALAVLATALVDNVITNPEKISIAVAFLGALGVYAVTNTPKEQQ